jgi:hypothetical protein
MARNVRHGGRLADRSKAVTTPKKTMARIATLFVFLVLAGSISLAGEGGAKVLDRTKVYHGLPDAFTAPAIVEASKVMDTLPAMKSIESEGVKKSSARWYLLVNEANLQFKKALKSVATDKGYDLIAEVGALSSTQTITNVTDDVIKAAAKPN